MAAPVVPHVGSSDRCPIGAIEAKGRSHSHGSGLSGLELSDVKRAPLKQEHPALAPPNEHPVNLRSLL